MDGEFAVRQRIALIFISFFMSTLRLIYVFSTIARYNDDLHDLMEKLVLLSEVATLSVKSRLHSPSMDFNVSIDVASQGTDDQTQIKNAKNHWESDRHSMINVLEEWDEPFQSGATETVSQSTTIIARTLNKS